MLLCLNIIFSRHTRQLSADYHSLSESAASNSLFLLIGVQEIVGWRGCLEDAPVVVSQEVLLLRYQRNLGSCQSVSSPPWCAAQYVESAMLRNLCKFLIRCNPCWGDQWDAVQLIPFRILSVYAHTPLLICSVLYVTNSTRTARLLSGGSFLSPNSSFSVTNRGQSSVAMSRKI